MIIKTTLISYTQVVTMIQMSTYPHHQAIMTIMVNDDEKVFGFLYWLQRHLFFLDSLGPQSDKSKEIPLTVFI